MGASGISTVDKLLVARPRPSIEQLETVTSSSFPSGHSTAAAALGVALLLAILDHRARPSIAVSAALATTFLVVGVALSRMYLGVHYPSDVVAGLMLGAAWAGFVAMVVGRRCPVDAAGRSSRDSRRARRFMIVV